MIFVYTFLSVYALWVFYLAVMALFSAKQKGTISKVALFFGWPVLIVGALIDFVLNVFLLTFIFLERPREWLITQRLARHIKKGSGWRQKLAKWVCANFLDAFDPDHRGHCR